MTRVKNTVACYYFPNYHVDPRNEALHGSGWTEWELVRRATPRFKGHHQPLVPLWGYEDESKPSVMAKKIDAAARHGIDAFIFDWYWYDDGSFLERGLEKGFLKAPNRERLKFAVMWANHDWQDIHPAKRKSPRPVLYPGIVKPATFEYITDYVIQNYFGQPNHWNIDACPYFSVYELYRLVQSLGGLEATRKALKRFREKTRAAGFRDLHLNGVVWGVRVLPGEKKVENAAGLVSFLGLDSVTSYVWVHHVPLRQFPAIDYVRVMKQAESNWRKTASEYSVPYFPNVSMGWDPSPRTVQSDRYTDSGYPFTATIEGNTPAAFKQALRRAKRFMQRNSSSRRIVTINAWNEWTEGSYLEPDTIHGMRYLEAIKQVFG